MSGRTLIALPEMRQCPALITAVDTRTAHSLLSDTTRDLGQVKHRTARTRNSHYHGAVGKTEVTSRNLTGTVTRLTQNLHGIHLKSLLKGTSRKRLKSSRLIRLDKALHIGLSLVQSLAYHTVFVLCEVFVVDTEGITVIHDTADGKLRDIVDELTSSLKTVRPDDSLKDYARHRTD